MKFNKLNILAVLSVMVFGASASYYYFHVAQKSPSIVSYATENASALAAKQPITISEASADFPSPTPTPEVTPTPITPTSVAPAPAANPAHTPIAVVAKPKIMATPKPAPTKAPAQVKTATTAVAAAPTSCGGGYSAEFLCLLNQYRASQGKGRLTASSGLASVAAKYSNVMLSSGNFAHIGPDGLHFYDRCKAEGIVCRAENLSMGAGSAQNLLTLWKNSPGHNANLLGPYTTFGLGVAGIYATALFN